MEAFPRPLTGWTGQNSGDEVMDRTGLAEWCWNRCADILSSRLGEVVIAETGLPPPIVEEMALHPEGYRSTPQWQPIPRLVVDPLDRTRAQDLNWLGYAIFISALLPWPLAGRFTTPSKK